MEYDVWFARYEGDLYAVTCTPGEPPNHRPYKVRSAANTLRRIKSKGHKIVEVGITDPEMIGLE